MEGFFLKNIDFCLFASGVSFFLLASLIFPLGRLKRQRLPWKYLGLFFLLFGITVWLEMITLLDDSPFFHAVRVALLAAGFLCLLEFGRAGSVAVGANVPRRWVIFLPVPLALVGAFGGISGLNAGVLYFLGIPGALWAAWVFLRYRRCEEKSRRAVMAASAALAVFGLTLIIVPSHGGVLPGALFAHASVMPTARYLVQFAQGMLAFITAAGFWIHYLVIRRKLLDAAQHRMDLHEFLLLPLFIAAIIGGFAFTSLVGNIREAQERQVLVTMVKTAAVGVDARMVSRLTGTDADLASPDYRILKARMASLRQAAKGVRFYYLMRKKGETAILLVDSEPESSPDYSPPGQVYEEQTPELKAAFLSEEPVIIGPMKDRWGTWISAVSTIKNRDGLNAGLIAFDINMTDWWRWIVRVRLGSILVSMLFSILLILFYTSQRRNRDDRFAIENAVDEQSLLLNTINTQMWYLSSPETFGLVNEAHAAFYGRTAAQMSHSRLQAFIPEEDARPRIESNREVFASGKRLTMELWARNGSGEKRFLHVIKTPKLDAEGDVEYVVCSAEDITEQKLMESALKLSEAQFRSYFELPLIGIAITSIDKGWVEVNDRLCDILGYSCTELQGMTWTELTHPDDLAADLEQFNRMLDGRIESYSMDKRFIRKGGGAIWTSLAVGCVRNPDRTVDFMLTLVQDISDRKRAEEALRVSEERYRLITENSSDVIWTMTLDGRFTYVSPSVTDLAGFTPEEVLDIPLSSYILPEYIPDVMAELKRELENQPEKRIRYKRMEIKQFARDGSVIDIEINANWIFNEKGEPAGIQGSTRDIRERKRAEEALHESEERFRFFAENSTDVIWAITLDGRITYISPSITRLTGFTQEEFVREKMQRRLVSEYAPVVIEKLKNELSTKPFKPGRTVTLDVQLLAKDGSKIDVEATTSWILDDRGVPIGLQGASRDIRARKRAEAELRDRERELNAITASAQDGIVMIDNDGNVSFWNDAATRILGYGRDEIMGRNLHETIMPERYLEPYRTAFPRFRETGEGAAVGKTLELAAIRKDGIEIPVDLSMSAMRLKDRWCAVGIIRDITERKKAEAAQVKSMEEKGILLRELQHRVKNSMAMIVGLVDLEANRNAGEDAKHALSKVRDRIMSLADLYDLLYRSEEIKEVRLDQYLDKMCRSLIDTYGFEGNRISLKMDMDEARIQVKSAIPVGLVVNEIITNSLKYAFPGGRRGTVGVILRAAPDALSITVYDDGAGLPESFDEKQSKGMGSVLVGLMVKQLKGTYAIERGRGTAYRITIPLQGAR